MKNTILKRLALILSVVLIVSGTISSCTRETVTPSGSDSTGNNNNNNNNGNSNAVSVTTGTWMVTTFLEEGENKTGDFAGIDFTFSTNGTVTASGSQSATGSWSTSGSTFTMNIGTDNPLKRLSEPWRIVEATATILRLEHPEANENEQVTFTRK